MRDALLAIWITNAILLAAAVSLYIQNRRRQEEIDRRLEQIDRLRAAIARTVQRE